MSSTDTVPVTNPANGESIATLALGGPDDVDAAVAAARAALGAWSASSKSTRIALLEKLASAYEARASEMATAISTEMGAPIKLARRAQVPAGLGNIRNFLKVFADFDFEERSTLSAKEVIRLEPVGVVAAITPWNW